MNFSDSFNPAKYQNPSYSEESEENENFTESMSLSSTDSFQSDNLDVEKGHKKLLKVDIGQFNELCKRFKEKQNLKIKNLTDKDKDDFNTVVSYVHLLYGTNYYKHIHEKVKLHFGDIKSVKPGTVGGYFAGCLVSTNYDIDKPGCAVACAGAIPLPKDEDGWKFCDKAVILADKEGKGYKFTLVKPAESENDEPAYIFVEHNSLHDFNGFCQDEKDEIKSMGYKKVHLIGYGEDGVSYSDFYGESKRLCDIKHRSNRKKCKKNNNVALAIILTIVFLFLIILFFGYRFWNETTIKY